MNDSSLLCMPSCKCPVFSHACLGFILFHIHVKIPPFSDLGNFHIWKSFVFRLTRRSAIGSDFRNSPQDFRLPALIFHSPQSAANALRSISRGAKTAPFSNCPANFFLVIGKHFRKRISYYAKKPDERKERLIDMVIL